MKSCKLCKLSRTCNDLPGFCLLIPPVTAFVVAISVGVLFITQEVLA